MDDYGGNVAEILELVKTRRGVDFTAYRPTTVRRRISLRLLKLCLPDFSAFCELLRNDPAEVDALYDSFLIKVSCFFRNPMVFELLGALVLPELLDALGKEQFRVWSAGCANGEEAYSVGMLIDDLASPEVLPARPLILATDIESRMLRKGETNFYEAEALGEVKKRYLDRYFLKSPDGLYSVREEIRAMVSFVRHDLADLIPPREGIFAGYHLILCRNTLIYFSPELRLKVLSMLADCLVGRGVLVLGESEMLPESVGHEFHEIVARSGIFLKREGP